MDERGEWEKMRCWEEMGSWDLLKESEEIMTLIVQNCNWVKYHKGFRLFESLSTASLDEIP